MIVTDSSKKQRLLLFDLLRIIAIILVVIWHLSTTYQIQPFNFINIYFGMFEISAGTIGVSLFIFISGAMLQYTSNEITSKNELVTFYKNRFLRIYPILWVSLVLIIIIQTWVLSSFSPFEILFSFTGLSILFHSNGIESWFISTIVVLYLLFPLVSYYIKKRPYLSILSIIVFSLGLRYLLFVLYYGKDVWLSDSLHWFPLCSLFEFGLGIFIVQENLFPRIFHNYSLITWLSVLSFPIFLVHGLVKPSFGISPYLFIFEMLFLSCILYTVDNQMQVVLRPLIKNFTNRNKEK